ncbi:hypothetical protein [Fulvivirga ligni]|uniref:hypothetical protein n=1 Tax=Fulvivirga ligni TaxID=2904246 RepID=UPI001F28CD6A|nr:hypothetical protein [Fulvivirga ligni]UII23377.1 hypothetical protein LVD16_09075 [Fulvivirga ligni]
MKFVLSILFTSILFATEYRNAVYPALNSGSLDKVESVIASLKGSGAEIDAYKGTLLMKKADLVKGPAKKLDLFKEGHELLENAIAADSDNPEFRFLRLSIQEHAPKILNYNDEIEADKAVIVKSYSSLDSDLKKWVKDYVSHSTVLKAEDLID